MTSPSPHQHGADRPQSLSSKAQPAVFLPPPTQQSSPPLGNASRGFRRPPLSSGNVRQPSASPTTAESKHYAILTPAIAHAGGPAATGVSPTKLSGYLAPHSPAHGRLVSSNGNGNGNGSFYPRQHSASMRGTPAAQRTASASYSARALALTAPTGLPRPPEKGLSAFGGASRLAQMDARVHTAGENGSAASDAAALAPTRLPAFSSLSSSFNAPPAAPGASPSNTTSYYVVGGAVINPQLTVSPSVQGEVRGVASLVATPDSMKRPRVGPQLRNTHAAAAAATMVSSSAQDGDAGTSPNNAELVSEDVEEAEERRILQIEGIRSARTPPEPTVPPLLQPVQNAQNKSLRVLRELYGTTADDVIEMAQANQKSGALEPPRQQYHRVRELLPELSNAEAQLKTLANARRRIDWDVSIPTADTLPPPAITFTSVNSTPVATLNVVCFTVDTSTLVLRRDTAAEALVRRNSESKETAASGTFAIASAAAGGTSAGLKAAGFLDEERVGLEVTREDRLGGSGQYRIHRLVGLRPGLGEIVGLDRVLEYDVHTNATELFISPPSIDASAGDLMMEVNTSLQGTAKLLITGVDCGRVDVETGTVLRGSNTLTCYVSVQRGTSYINGHRAGSDTPDHLFAGTLDGIHTEYARVPSAMPQWAIVGQAAFTNASLPATNGGNTQATANAQQQQQQQQQQVATDGFALAHFNQEGSCSCSTSHPREMECRGGNARPTSPSLGRDGMNNTNGGGVDSAATRLPPRNLNVQTIAARNAAAAAGREHNSASATISCACRGGTAGRSQPRRCDSPSPFLAAGAAPASKSSHVERKDAPYFFTTTNPHDLRYTHCVEQTRRRRLHHQHAALQEAAKQHKNKEAERQASLSAARAATPPLSSNGGPRPEQKDGSGNAWSDEDDEDKELSLGASEESPAWRSPPINAVGSSASRGKRKQRKTVVEVLELEREFDQNVPVAMPTVTIMGGGSNASLTIGATQNYHGGAVNSRRPTSSPSSRHALPPPAPSPASLQHPDVERDQDMRELRRSHLLSSLFVMGTMQSPVSYLRLTVWQDRLIVLFNDRDKDLLRSDQRARFKREARQELSDGALAGTFVNISAWSTAGLSNSMSMGGRKASMQSRRVSSMLIPRNYSAANDGTSTTAASSHNNNPFAAFSNRAAATPASSNDLVGGGTSDAAGDHSFALVRRLILCLALEEERSSVQLFADTVQLCSHLCQAALAKTASLTRGTRDGLQQAAAAVLTSSSPVSSPRQGHGRANVTAYVLEGNASLSAKDRAALQLLSETLELAMTVMLLLGAYADAVEYATQRVHTLCLLEGDTNAVVNAAQRDLAEAYLFYGDYATAATIAEDVVTLTRRLCEDAPSAYEVAEAEVLCALACVAAGRRERLSYYVERLELDVLPMEEDPHGGAPHTPQPLLQAQLRLVLSFAKMHTAHVDSNAQENDNAAQTHEEVARLAREAVRLLRSDGDLQEVEQSFSTIFPSQVRFSSAVEGGSASLATALRGRRTSMANFSTAAIAAAGSGGGAGLYNNNNGGRDMEAATPQVMAAQKRLRWNLLCFAGALLVQSDVVAEGIEVMENTVKELVLGQHRYLERNHRSSIASLLWVGLVLAKSWAEQETLEDVVAMLKQMANRVVRIRGPLHPFAAVSNLMYAYMTHQATNSRHGLSVVARSLSVLERNVSSQSHYLLMAHHIFGVMAGSQRRWRLALEHLNTAYVIAQMDRLSDKDLTPLDTCFVGALLQCPTTAVLDIDTVALRAQVAGRLARAKRRFGAQSEALVEPLWNMAEVLHLLGQSTSAEAYLQQAVRLLDRRGVLLASTDLLKPKDVFQLEQQRAHDTPQQVSEQTKQLLQQRNTLVQSSFDTVEQVLRLATCLYMWAAVQEPQGRTTEAEAKYGQCLALYECINLDDTLAAAQVVSALAKLYYTASRSGDALRWGSKAELLLHTHYRKQWPQEYDAAKKLVAIVEPRLYEEEGTYVIEDDTTAVAFLGLPQLL